MTDSNKSTYSAFIPQVWSQKLNQMLDKNCVMLQCVNRNWEGEIKNQGDTVKIITPADVTVSTLTSDNIEYAQNAPADQNFNRIFTREEIGRMSGDEFTRNEKMIMDQLKNGLIK